MCRVHCRFAVVLVRVYQYGYDKKLGFTRRAFGVIHGHNWTVFLARRLVTTDSWLEAGHHLNVVEIFVRIRIGKVTMARTGPRLKGNCRLTDSQRWESLNVNVVAIRGSQKKWHGWFWVRMTYCNWYYSATKRLLR